MKYLPLTFLLLFGLMGCSDKTAFVSDSDELDRQKQGNPVEWKAAMEFLERPDLETLATGRYDLTGQGTYANVQEYDTRTEGDFEAHRKFIDIQYIVSGRERIDVAPIDAKDEEITAYSEDDDFELMSISSSITPVVMKPGKMAILFPKDAHRPSMSIGSTPEKVKKVVIKVPYYD